MLTANLDIERCCRRKSTAARVSIVGISPQQAMTTSGSAPWSCPLPDAEPIRAVLDGFIHGEVLQRRLLTGNNDIDVARTKTVIGH